MGKCSLNGVNSEDLIKKTKGILRGFSKNEVSGPEAVLRVKKALKDQFDIEYSDDETASTAIYLAMMQRKFNISLEDVKTILYGTNQEEIKNPTQTDAEKLKQVEGDKTTELKYSIDSNYGAASDIYIKMKQDFKVGLVKQALFDLQRNVRVNGSLAGFNLGIKNFQEQLYKTLVDYIKKKGNKEQKEIITNSVLYSQDRYTGDFDKYISIFEDVLIPKGGVNGNWLYYKSVTDPQYIQAYNAYIVLSNFDNMLSSVFGKNITINHNEGNFTESNDKYNIKAVNKLPSNWRTNDDIDAQKEMDQITSLLVSVFEMYTDHNIKQPNNYMNMQQFIYITGKVKALPKTNDFKLKHQFKWKNKLGNVNKTTYLDSDEIELLESKGINNLIELIESIDDNPQLYWRLTFKYLANYLKGVSSRSIGNDWYPLDKSLIISLYKNVYADNNTLFSLFYDEFNSSSNYYSYITQAQTSLSALDYLRYQISEDGKLMDTTLHKSGGDVFKSYFERLINAKYSKKSEIQHKLIKETYNVQYIPTSGRITYTLEPGSSGDTIKVSYDIQKAQVELYIGDQGQTKIQASQYSDYKQQIQNLLQRVLGYQLNEEFFTTLDAIKGVTNNQDRASVLAEMLKISSDLISSDYFTHEFNEVKDGVVIDKYKNKGSLESAAKAYYGDTRLTNLIFRSSSGEYGVLMKDMLPILNPIATAQSIVEGRTIKGTEKDADGNDLGNSSMSRLYTNLFNQLRVEGRKEGSAISESSIVQKNLVKGTILSREFKGDENKTATDFNSNESYYVSFLYDFLEKSDSSEILIQPCVVADKSMILKAVTDINVLKSIIPGVDPAKPITSLNSSQVWEVVANEFGQIYSKIFDNIEKDWNTLNEFVRNNRLFTSTEEQLVFDPFNDFKNFNNWCNNAGLNPNQVLERVLKAFQKAYPDSSLTIRQQIHYISVKGALHFNPTLISMLNRFNPEKLKQIAGDSKAYTVKNKKIIKFNNTKLTDLQGFVDIQEEHLIEDLVSNNFQIDLEENTLPKAIKLLSADKQWVDSSVNKLYIAKVTTGTGKNKKVTYIRTKKQWDQVKNVKSKKVEIHPLISLHNAIGYFVGQEYVMASMGVSAINPAKKTQRGYDDIEELYDLAEESERYTMSTKRNVTLTGNMNRYMMGLIDGMPNVVKVSILEDVKSNVFNLMADQQTATIFDGAIFTVGPVCYMQNNSLAGAAAGIDQKPLWHAYNSDIASADIIKTASFGCTNERARKSEFIERLNRKGLDIAWDAKHDITKLGLNGKHNVPDKVYFKDYDGSIKVRTNLKFENGEYTYNEYTTDILGEAILGDIAPKKMSMNSNYDVYLYLGGSRSCSFLNGELQLSEASMMTLANIINFTGEKKRDKVLTSDDVIQPLKDKMLYYHVTEGAMKKGVGNINSVSAYYDDEPLLHTFVNMKMSGIQLDKTHEADNAHLSIMTQVINSLCSRGYTEEQANDVYKAIQAVTELVIQDEITAYRKHLGLIGSQSDVQLRKLMGSLMVKQLASSNTDDVSMAKAVVSELIDVYNNGTDLQKLPSIDLPISDSAIFNKFVSTVASTLSKTAIKLKFDGLLAVLTPSHTIYKVFGGKLLNEFNSKKELISLQEESLRKPLDSSQLNVGTSYYEIVPVRTANGEIYFEKGKLVHVKSPIDYWNLRKQSGKRYCEAICDVQEAFDFVVGKEYIDAAGNSVIYTRDVVTTAGWKQVIPIGRDLNTYNIYFTAKDGKKYSMWDLSIVYEMYHKNPKALNKKDRELLQQELNNIATEQVGVVNVVEFVGGEVLSKSVEIDCNDIKVQSYENILPQMYKSKFGLSSQDSVDTISKLDSDGNPTYFVNKLQKAYQSQLHSLKYDLELQNLSGKHTYLIHSSNIDKDVTGLRKAGNRRVISDNGKFWFVNGVGNKIKEASSLNDSIYYDPNNVEIIVTDNIEFYLRNEEYFNINVSETIEGNKEFMNHLYDVFSNVDINEVQEAFSRYWENGVFTFVDNKQIDMEKIYQKAKQMHTSYMMSLYTLAARIPSQSMQSFMAMKTVGYDSSGVNNVYVNPYQIWLQGSDFDIDTVNMLGYSFSDSGEFMHWSPYADFSNIVNLEASTRIPFPNGVAVSGVYQTESGASDTVDQAINTLQELKDQIIKRQFNSKQDVYKFATALKVLSLSVAEDGGILNTSIGDQKVLKFVTRTLNTHNRYIANMRSSKKIEKVTKNYISATMFDIIKNPINMIQAQSPIDKAVDAFKSIGDESPKAQDTIRNTPGNYYNHGVELFNNMAGKKVTGIVAAGMKALLGVTHATNFALNQGEGIENVMFFKKIGKGNYQITANAFSVNITNADVLHALEVTRNTQDSVLILSALLSLATDNAKELQLSKLNATEELVSLYIAGITIGMELEELANLMMSDTMEGLLSIMRGNIFLKQSGLPRFEQALNYVQMGPSLRGEAVTKTHLESIRNFILENFEGDLEEMKEYYVYSKDRDGNIVKDQLRGVYPGDLQQMIAYPDLVWTQELVDKLFAEIFKDSSKTSTKINRFKEDLEQWFDIKLLSQQGDFEKLLQLHDIGTELTSTTMLQGVNQGLDTSREDILKFRNYFEQLFQQKYKHSRNSVIQDRFLNTPVAINTIKDETLKEMLIKQADSGPVLRKHVFSLVAKLSTQAHKDSKTFKLSDYSISLTSFLNDSKYRENIISLFNLLKGAVNVPYVIYNNQHYRGYLLAFDTLHHSLLASSYKYRELSSTGLSAVESYNFNSSEKSQAIKKVEKFLDTHIINQWLQRQGLLTVPEGVVIVDESMKPFTTSAPVQIQLGTLQGNVSFKSYMENYIIPDLKKGIIGKTADGKPIINYKGSDFINDLNYELLDRTVDKNAISIMALPINMMPKTDMEQVKLNNYKESFNRLRTVSYYGIPVLDLLLYYNMIVHGTSTNSNSFLPLFASLKMDNDFEKLNNYYKFVAEIDANTQIGGDYDQDRLVLELAPVKNLFRDYSKGPVLGRDPEELEYKLWEWQGWYSSIQTEEGREKVRNRLPYKPSTQKLHSQHTPFSNLINAYDTTISVGPGHSVTLRSENDKIEVVSISYGNQLIKNTKTGKNTLKHYVNEYNKNHSEQFQISSISDLIVYEHTPQGPKINLELTWESIDRMFNDPC